MMGKVSISPGYREKTLGWEVFPGVYRRSSRSCTTELIVC